MTLTILLIVAYLGSRLSTVRATIFTSNMSLPSLPALFGQPMEDGKVYNARLQYLPENPYLCDVFEENATSFITPFDTLGEDNRTVPAQDVVLLASRGICPFARKAQVAESIGPAVKYLIVYNNDLEGEDAIVPMFTEHGDSVLMLVSVSHRSGRSLRQYLASQTEDILLEGGPEIKMDSVPPPGMLSSEQLQQMMLTAVGLFFIFVCCSGCVMIIINSHGEQPNSMFAFATVPRRTRLSEGQVHALPKQTENTLELGCAICLEDDLSSNWTKLPCGHHFHTECVLPWLTERQPKCPLCKFDVLEHVVEEELRDGSKFSGNPLEYIWTRITRYHWTRVNLSSREDDDVFMGSSSDEIEDMELSDSQQIPPQIQ